MRTTVSTPDNDNVIRASRRRFLEGLAGLGGGVTIAASTVRFLHGAQVQGSRDGSGQRQGTQDSACLKTSSTPISRSCPTTPCGRRISGRRASVRGERSPGFGPETSTH